MRKMNIVLWGNGGHGKRIQVQFSDRVVSVLDDATLTKDDILPGSGTRFHCAIGDNETRAWKTETLVSVDAWIPETLRVPTSTVENEAAVGDGAYIGAGAVVCAHARVGAGAIVNTGAIVEHDCVLGAFSHVAPSVTLCGNVRVGMFAFVGARSVVREKISIGRGAWIGAGSVVVADVPPFATAFGVPAKSLECSWCAEKLVDFDAIGALLRPSLKTRRVTNGSPLVERLGNVLHREMQLDESRVVLPTASGSAALQAAAALCAWKLRTDGRPFQAVTSAHGFVPVKQGNWSGIFLVDVEDRSMRPDADAIRMCIESGSATVLVVTHSFGYVLDDRDIVACARDHNILIVYDLASSMYARHGERSLALDADVSVVSLHETKPWGRGEGGAVIVRAEDADTMRAILNKFGGDEYGGNFRMSDFSAAFHIQWLCSEWQTAKTTRRALWDTVRTEISRVRRETGSVLERYPGATESAVLACIPLRTSSVVELSILERAGFEAKRYYVPLATLPVVTREFMHTVCLPFHERMRAHEIRAMFRALSSLLRSETLRSSKTHEEISDDGCSGSDNTIVTPVS